MSPILSFQTAHPQPPGTPTIPPGSPVPLPPAFAYSVPSTKNALPSTFAYLRQIQLQSQLGEGILPGVFPDPPPKSLLSQRTSPALNAAALLE